MPEIDGRGDTYQQEFLKEVQDYVATGIQVIKTYKRDRGEL
jgi:hypothetical protein